MKSIPKLIRRFLGLLLLSSVLLLALNLIVLAVVASKPASNSYPWKTAEKAAAVLQKSGGEYTLPKEMSAELKSHNVWGIFIDNETMKVVWHTENLPESVPMNYTVSGIAGLTRGYVNGYPTFTGEAENGLLVLGYPQKSYWKHMWPSWDYQLIAGMPKIVLFILAVNILLLLLIYVIANAKLLKSMRPIVNGIQSLGAGETVYINEKGLLSELADCINQTSEVLQSQSYQLRKKETARANWIAGVSHDIRTPLSMVMGYAGQLEAEEGLSESERKKASVIREQSERMRNLINDLNLASKLEYNMQPFNEKRVNAVAIVRQTVVDFINSNMDDKYQFEWEMNERTSSCFVRADKDLLKRAVSNLIQNCISHNEKGCAVYVSVRAEGKTCIICVEDNGAGASDEQIEKLNTAPHYMVCDTNTTEQRHGLGLLIVKQIAASHNGTAVIGHSIHGGFSVKIRLPLLSEFA